MASRAFSLISLRARSWRSRRSSMVMGTASLLRDFNFARDGGREESSAGEAASECDVAAMAAVRPPTSMKRRREIMSPPEIEQCLRHYMAQASHFAGVSKMYVQRYTYSVAF